jgi:hypothetical protein
MRIDRPIFIVGPHRSGTTLLYRLMAKHPEVGFFNMLNKRLPGHPRLANFLTGIVKPDYPVEAQQIWDRFKRNDVDVMTAEDASPAVAEWYRRLVDRVLAIRRRERFITKYPRLSLRLDWVDAVFPDALFIHMTRDWRAVVNSTLNRKVKREGRGGGWFGVYVPGWKDLESLPHEVASARIFRIVTRALEEDAGRFGDRMMQVSYEDLCWEPVAVLKSLTAACGLRWTDGFEASIPGKFESANFKWRDGLGDEMAARIRAEDPDFYSRYEKEPA